MSKPTKIKASKTRTPAQYSGLLADLIQKIQGNPTEAKKKLADMGELLYQITPRNNEAILAIELAARITILEEQLKLYDILRNNGLVE